MKYELNSNVEGIITGISKYGLFVKIDDEYTGMIHISEISSRYIKDIRQLYVIGERIESNIIDIDSEKKHLKLSLKSNLNNRNDSRKLKEDGKGFEPLKNNLSIWVEKKLNDIENSKKINKN